MTEESKLKRDICDFLAVQPEIIFTLNPRGDANRKSSKYMAKGYPDISGVKRVAQFAVPFFIEVKTKTGRVSKEQEEFITRAKALGCLAFVARSVSDVELQFHALRSVW